MYNLFRFVLFSQYFFYESNVRTHPHKHMWWYVIYHHHITTVPKFWARHFYYYDNNNDLTNVVVFVFWKSRNLHAKNKARMNFARLHTKPWAQTQTHLKHFKCKTKQSASLIAILCFVIGIESWMLAKQIKTKSNRKPLAFRALMWSALAHILSIAPISSANYATRILHVHRSEEEKTHKLRSEHKNDSNNRMKMGE